MQGRGLGIVIITIKIDGFRLLGAFIYIYIKPPGPKFLAFSNFGQYIYFLLFVRITVPLPLYGQFYLYFVY